MAVPIPHSVTDYIHNLRLMLQSHTPGLDILSSLSPATAAMNGAVQPDILNNHVPKMIPQVPPQAPMAPGVSPPISGQPAPTPAIQPTQPMPPVQGLDMPMAPQVPMPQPRPPQAPQAQAQVPMPMARPEGAPSGQPMGFFQRNTAMMRDPATGDFIDPMAAQQAQADITGPALVQKFMNYLHKETS
jgi:hypothetical protein